MERGSVVGVGAVGRYLGTKWARPITLEEAVALVDRVRVAAEIGARAALAALAASVPMPIRAIALRACPDLPPTTEERIADNRAQTFADSVMYRRALAAAAESRGWAVHWYDHVASEDPRFAAMGRALGPPWRAEHKRAAAAAAAALGLARAVTR
jgi:hypothetical protein